MPDNTEMSQLLDILIRIDKRLQSIESGLGNSSSNTTAEKSITEDPKILVDHKKTTQISEVDFVHDVDEVGLVNDQEALCFFDDSRDKLPAGWEISVAYDGRVFYIDHNTRSTSWTRPMVNKASSDTQALTQLGCLDEASTIYADRTNIDFRSRGIHNSKSLYMPFGVPYDCRIMLGVDFWELNPTEFQLSQWEFAAVLSTFIEDSKSKADYIIRDFDIYGNSFDYRPSESRPVRERWNYEKGLKFPCNPTSVAGSGSKTSSPWKRIVIIKGLHSMLDDEKVCNITRKLTPSALPGGLLELLLYYSKYEGYLHVDLSFANPENLAWQIRGAMSFHLVFFSMVDSDDGIRSGTWPIGELYGVKKTFQKQAYTLKIQFEDRSAIAPTDRSIKSLYNPTEYWTLLRLLPFGYNSQPNPPEFVTLSTAGITMLGFIKHDIPAIVEGWILLADYFDNNFDNATAYLNPEAHDGLLVDDEAFSRSRKYFWAISCLMDFDRHIADNIKQWDKSSDIWRSIFPDFDPKNWSQAQEYMEDIEKEFERLREVKRRFKEHLDRINLLRDGLFNASAVMESRASTRLGENVKLLTFVSIFFLPLGFCMSLWSISFDTFSKMPFIYVTIIVAIMTYMLVFNLNNVVRISAAVYRHRRQAIIDAMSEDKGSEGWREKGARFKSYEFRARSHKGEPSEWLLTVYFIFRLWSSTKNGLYQFLPPTKPLFRMFKKGSNTSISPSLTINTSEESRLSNSLDSTASHDEVVASRQGDRGIIQSSVMGGLNLDSGPERTDSKIV